MNELPSPMNADRNETPSRKLGPERVGWCNFFFQAEDGIRYVAVTGVQTCALPIFDKRPRFAGLALDTAPGSRGRGVSKISERVLDNADDLIHGLVVLQWFLMLPGILQPAKEGVTPGSE